MTKPYDTKCLKCNGIIVLVEGTTPRWSHFGARNADHEPVPPEDQVIESTLEGPAVEILLRPSTSTDEPVGTFDFEDTSDLPGKASILHLVDLGKRLQNRGDQ